MKLKSGILEQSYIKAVCRIASRLNGLPCQAGIYAKEEVLRSLVVVISNATELQGYAVRALYRAFHNWSGQV